MIPRFLTDFANQLVSRYTSYSISPQFGGEVDGVVYDGWLAGAVSGAESISVYLHAPFCRSIRHYCSCTTTAIRWEAPLEAYGERLRRELDLALATWRYGQTSAIFEHDLEKRETLRRSGFIRYVGDRLAIMRDGSALARIVASAFESISKAAYAIRSPRETDRDGLSRRRFASSPAPARGREGLD